MVEKTAEMGEEVEEKAGVMENMMAGTVIGMGPARWPSAAFGSPQFPNFSFMTELFLR